MTEEHSPTYSDPEQRIAGTAIDTTVPHSARIWNYWLGGKDNYEIDRVAGDQFSGIYPGIVDIARADRAFLGRVIRFLAGEAGVRRVPRRGDRAADRGQYASGRAARRPGVTDRVRR